MDTFLSIKNPSMTMIGQTEQQPLMKATSPNSLDERGKRDLNSLEQQHQSDKMSFIVCDFGVLPRANKLRKLERETTTAIVTSGSSVFNVSTMSTKEHDQNAITTHHHYGIHPTKVEEGAFNSNANTSFFPVIRRQRGYGFDSAEFTPQECLSGTPLTSRPQFTC